MTTPLVSVSFNGAKAYGIFPRSDVTQLNEHIKPLRRGTRVGFVDLTPTNHILAFVRNLEAAGIRVSVFLDHHFDPQKADKNPGLVWLNSDSRQVVTMGKSNAPSAVHLIRQTPRERFQDVDVWFFHLDADGFLALLLACGIDYLGIAEDAQVLEARTFIKADSLSPTGWYLYNARYAIPPSVSDRITYAMTASYYYQTVGDWIAAGFPREKISDLRAEVDAAFKTAKQNAGQMAINSVQLLGRICFTDFRAYACNGKYVSVFDWKKRVSTLFADTALFCWADTSDENGVKYHAELAFGWREFVNLHQLLPPGDHGQTSFRAHMTPAEWPHFQKNWYDLLARKNLL
jgi:hypothetical protein